MADPVSDEHIDDEDDTGVGPEGAPPGDDDGDGDLQPLAKAHARQQKQIRKLRAKLAEQEQALKQFDGINIERVREMEKEVEQREREKLEAQGKWEELAEKRIAKVTETKDAELKKLRAEFEATQGRLHQILIVDGFKKELADVKGFRSEKGVLDDVERFARDNIRLIDGVPTPIESEDNPQIGEDGQNKSLAQLAAEMVKAKPHWFAPASGGGAQNLNGSTPAGKPNTDGLTPVERMRRFYEQRTT